MSTQLGLNAAGLSSGTFDEQISEENNDLFEEMCSQRQCSFFEDIWHDKEKEITFSSSPPPSKLVNFLISQGYCK